METLPWGRQGSQDGKIPEEYLQEQGKISERLNVDRSHLRNEPVGRQSGHTDNKTENCRADYAEYGDQNRIEQADDKGSAVGTVFGIGNQVLDNAESGLLLEKGEAGSNTTLLKIMYCVVADIHKKANNGTNQQGLEK